VRDGPLIPRFGRARRDPALAVLEGFHAVKHALRFGANVTELVTRDPQELSRLGNLLAPDLAERIDALARATSPEVFEKLAPLPPSTGVISLAERPLVEAAAALDAASPGPVVLLEDPRDLGNAGACVRVAAAAEAAAVLTTGSHDPWHPDAVRGSAGLHFALPVARLADTQPLGACGRPLIAVDPDGEPLDPSRLAPDAILAFGTERYGLSDELSARAAAAVSIPMRPGVSSLNLATSVAAVLFAWRLSPLSSSALPRRRPAGASSP
jgi:TrmH family RNA methyltransferase